MFATFTPTFNGHTLPDLLAPLATRFPTLACSHVRGIFLATGGIHDLLEVKLLELAGRHALGVGVRLFQRLQVDAAAQVAHQVDFRLDLQEICVQEISNEYGKPYNSLEEYKDVYLKTDVLILPDTVEKIFI